MSHEPPIITNDTRIWLFKTNPKYYTHIMKPVEGGPIQQFIQNNSHVCVHYKPGDIAMVWLTGDKGKGQMISAYYIIKNIETKTQIQDAVIEDLKENEGHSFRLLDGSNRSEFIKTFEKRKQNSLQLVSAATGQEVPDALISQKSIIGQQVRLVWRRMNRLVYGESLHFLSTPFHLDGYNHNAYRLYKEIRPEHRDYVVQMILQPPAIPYPTYPPPPPLTSTPTSSDPQSPNSTSPTPQKMAINEIVTSDPHSHTQHTHPPPEMVQHVSELPDITGELDASPEQDLSTPQLVHLTDSPTLTASIPTTLTANLTATINSNLPPLNVITPLTTLQTSTMDFNKNMKRKRQSSKERVQQLSAELSLVRERLQKVENENYYLKYNLLQIASLGHTNSGLPYIPPLSSPPTTPSSVEQPLPDIALGSSTGSINSPMDDLSDDDEDKKDKKLHKSVFAQLMD